MKISLRSDYLVDTIELEQQIKVLKTILNNLEMELESAKHAGYLLERDANE